MRFLIEFDCPDEDNPEGLTVIEANSPVEAAEAFKETAAFHRWFYDRHVLTVTALGDSHRVTFTKIETIKVNVERA